MMFDVMKAVKGIKPIEIIDDILYLIMGANLLLTVVASCDYIGTLLGM